MKIRTYLLLLFMFSFYYCKCALLPHESNNHNNDYQDDIFDIEDASFDNPDSQGDLFDDDANAFNDSPSSSSQKLESLPPEKLFDIFNNLDPYGLTTMAYVNKSQFILVKGFIIHRIKTLKGDIISMLERLSAIRRWYKNNNRPQDLRHDLEYLILSKQYVHPMIDSYVANNIGRKRADMQQICGASLLHHIARGEITTAAWHMIMCIKRYAAGNQQEAQEHLQKKFLSKFINVTDKNGDTPLHFAAFYNANNVFTCILLDYGAVITAKNNAGNTPLHEAVRSGHLGIVKLLLHRGADVGALNNKQQTPEQYATERCSACCKNGTHYCPEHQEIADLLLHHLIGSLKVPSLLHGIAQTKKERVAHDHV